MPAVKISEETEELIEERQKVVETETGYRPSKKDIADGIIQDKLDS